VREDCGNDEASRALYVHEEGVGRLYKSLQLVLFLLGGSGGKSKIDRHFLSEVTD
tara:strand:+ start:259 stop:423 length:165 start_codon:yes stop_codon:yes gene_type:complete